LGIVGVFEIAVLATYIKVSKVFKWDDKYLQNFMLYILVYFHILCIQFKIITNSLITLFARLDVVIGILLTCGKHVHDCIISLRGEIWTHKTLTRQFLLKCLYQSRKVSDNVFVCLYCECDSDATSDKFLAMAERCDILM